VSKFSHVHSSVSMNEIEAQKSEKALGFETNRSGDEWRSSRLDSNK
jgi:hypothetical protein